MRKEGPHRDQVAVGCKELLVASKTRGHESEEEGDKGYNAF